MKPVFLRMEAFGPYGAKSSIDFEPLADVGLFVVSGPTGAGKSTIFDAMCFALYGSLSGARQSHVDVRSHYADPAADCQVEFVFDANGERWRVTRQPAQIRQKRRGSGTTERPADAVLERWIDGDWHPEAAKVRDVSARCRELVGLSLDQFERVVLLPQGKFAEVLNARTSERAELLRTLFGSDVFERVGDVLAQEAKQGEQALRGAADQRDRFRRRAIDTLDRADADLAGLRPEIAAELEAAGVQRRLRETTSAPHLDSTGSPGEPRSPSDRHPAAAQLSLLEMAQVPQGGPQHVGSVDEEASDLEVDLDDDPARRLELLRAGPVVDLESVVSSLHRAATTARSDLERAEAQAKAIEQRRAAMAELTRLDDQRPSMEALALRLQAARRVIGLAPALARRDHLSTASAEHRATLEQHWGRVVASVRSGILGGPPSLDPEPSPDLLGSLLEQATARSSSVEALMADEAALRRDRSEHLALHRRLADLAGAIGDGGAELSAVVVERTFLEGELESLDSVVAERPTLAGRHDALVSQVKARLRADETADELERLEHRLTEEAAAAAAARSAIDGATDEVALLDALIAQRRERQAAVDSSERRLARRSEIARITAELEELDVEVTARQAEADGVFAAFVRDAAPRLAAELHDGSPCPVCGSCEHPAPAEPGEAEAGLIIDAAVVEASSSVAAEARTRRDERRALLTALVADDPSLIEFDHDQLAAELSAARRALTDVDEADAARAELVDAMAELQRALDAALSTRAVIESDRAMAREQLANLLGELGSARDLTLDRLEEELARVRSSLDRVHAAERRRSVVAERLVALSAEQAGLEQKREELRIDWAKGNERLDHLAASIRQAEARRDATTKDDDLGAIHGQLTDLRKDLLRLQQLSTEMAASEASLEAAASACRRLIDEAGFETEDDAVAASLPEPELLAREAEHGEWVHRRTTLTATVEALDAQGLPEERPDIDLLRQAAIGSETKRRAASDALAAITQHCRQASVDLDEVRAIDATTSRQRAHHDVVRRVAAVVRGNNSRRLSLENWVLSVYLHDVVEHANVHLHTMSNGRYRLVVQDAPSNQIGQHGLDLVIDDAHTGRVRPSVSLSGGETFQASLALALGLADVVMVGRAGLHLDALFVDEGFGSLDADAIDQAITVLDGLRSRGSMVGVITHVEALKSALPVAIEVVPRPDHRGSEIRQVA